MGFSPQAIEQYEKEELEGEMIEDVGSELSEDMYDYSSDEVKK